jgi:hypothetical protein
MFELLNTFVGVFAVGLCVGVLITLITYNIYLSFKGKKYCSHECLSKNKVRSVSSSSSEATVSSLPKKSSYKKKSSKSVR